MMKYILSSVAASLLLLMTGTAGAYNFGYKKIMYLEFLGNSEIRFKLYDVDNRLEGNAFKCNGNQTQFVIESCPASNTKCEAANNRMASMLLSAHMLSKSILIERNQCKVTEVALRAF